MIKGLIVAAGLSKRMGVCKPLLIFKGKTLIEHSLDSMFAGEIESIVLVLGYRGEEIEALVNEKYPNEVTCIYNKEYANVDMLASIKLGIQALGTCEGFFLLPGDMPAIKKETFLQVRSCWKTHRCLVAFPTVQGYRKHPPLIDQRCIPAILSFEGTGGLRSVWKQFEGSIATKEVSDEGCEIDLDTMEDYQQWTIALDTKKS